MAEHRRRLLRVAPLSTFVAVDGTVVAAVWFVFRDPAFDYRLLLVGSVLPAVVDAFLARHPDLHESFPRARALELVPEGVVVGAPQASPPTPTTSIPMMRHAMR